MSFNFMVVVTSEMILEPINIKSTKYTFEEMQTIF